MQGVSRSDHFGDQSMSKHTPGPWRFNKRDEMDVAIWGSDGFTICGDVYVIADVSFPEKNDAYGHEEANARLIAAAPDLLEALEAAIEHGLVPKSSASEGGAMRHVSQVKCADQIRAAIAKAKGEA